MTKTIYKYPVVLDDIFVLNLPKNAQILTVQTQYEKPYLWVLLDPNAPKVERAFRLAGTGHHPCHSQPTFLILYRVACKQALLSY